MSKQSDTIKRSGIKQTKECLALREDLIRVNTSRIMLLIAVKKALGSSVGECGTATDGWTVEEVATWHAEAIAGNTVSVYWDFQDERIGARDGDPRKK